MVGALISFASLLGVHVFFHVQLYSQEGIVFTQHFVDSCEADAIAGYSKRISFLLNLIDQQVSILWGCQNGKLHFLITCINIQPANVYNYHCWSCTLTKSTSNIVGHGTGPVDVVTGKV